MRLVHLLAAAVLPLGAQPLKPISIESLRDKIAGGWAGQMIGVSYGAPTEFRYRGRTIPDGELPQWKPELVHNSIRQDDLYVDMTFAQVLDDKGLDATTEDFGAMFREANYSLWHANLAARRALRRGVPATLSGTPKYNVHANDIDFQIEADFIGLMAPGLPLAATEIAWRAGRVMNYGDGIYGGIFVACMYSAAFFETDPRKIVEAGLACLPRKSPYARVIADTLAWHRAHPGYWKKTWQLIEDKWNRRDPCPEGALRDFNIDAKLNGAYIALGLLYGGGDFGRTIVISTQAGQDSDCNPSNAAGILGVALGYDAIPDEWKSGIPAVADKVFSYTRFTFKTITESSVARAIALAEKNGGRRDGETLFVKTQKPRATRLEVWDDYGSPVERIAITDPRFRRAGDWQPGRSDALVSERKGATAEIDFEGTGFILVGQFLPDGGLADISVDGQAPVTVDVYPDENAIKNRESLHHQFKLKPGLHTVKLTVRGEPYPKSEGAKISLQGLVVFR